MAETKFEISGILKKSYSENWVQYKLVQPDGYEIDLVSRISEMIQSFPEMMFNVGYYVSNKPESKNKILEKILSSIYGGNSVGYDAESYSYSSMTNGTDFYTNLIIGGHDLKQEFEQYIDKFILIEINFFK